ncbi:kinase-like protein [Daedalea quercina L-15889]|uniref:non-specific serine/threonine protein kinase n=1 Tax=Daedalea quercina L-15889 TaxID=1314783 RepID=A0A165MQ13_9APHY|nr:kinase-like protein [Daedalea quercina L-15889]
MLKIEVSSPSPESSSLQTTPTLADLSRNASVISSSSSSSSTSDLTLQTPVRPRPMRTFSSPRTGMRSRTRSPQSPSTPRSSRPPAYLARELGLADERDDGPSELRPPSSRNPSQSRNSSVNGRVATTADDFEFGRVLGEGSYSTVMLAKHRTTQQEYAIKILDKGHLRRNGKLPTALAEKNTLVRLGAGHPGIVRLHWAFQDEWSLYFVLDLAKNGELQSRISRMGSLSTTCARIYAAQIVDALGYMHSKGVIHRDLKPENLLLDDAFRIKITDFGTGKILDSGGERTKTFVGTAQYVSPELLEDSETSKSSDFWALGCIVYQMISGRFAFQGLSEYLTWQKIKKLEYSFPEGFDAQAKDLVEKLLVRDPAQRLGAGPHGSSTDMQALRAHPFFASINWGTLWTDPVPPLEPGLVKKDPPQGANGSRWDDVGASWDALMGDSDPEDDISWASDGEGQELFALQGAKAPNGYAYYEDVGPMGELRPYAFPPAAGPNTNNANPPSSTSVAPDAGKDEGPTVRFADVPKVGSVAAPVDSSKAPANGVSTPHDVPSVVKAQPIDVPAPKGAVVDSYSTGSATSSSDGSPIEQLGAALEAAGIDRGRNRAQTPIHGNRAPAESEW